jgi:hypothetical protein
MIPAAEVRSEAERLSLSPRLRRLSAEGLLAPPRGAGRGRGRGREYSYPSRVSAQLAAIADAIPHGHRYAALRHWIWWSRGGRLENWELWRRDRLIDFAVQFRLWAMPAAVDGELPDERERHLNEVSEELRASRLPGMPKKRLHTLDDTQTYVRLFTSVLFRDDMLEPVTDPPEATWAQVQEVAAQRVDSDKEAALGGTLGALFERGSGWSHPPVPGVHPGVAALAAAHYLPTPRLGVAILMSMTEERAALVRDAVIGWTALNGTADVIREQPTMAAVVMSACELFAYGDPRILKVPEEPT